MKMNLGMVSCAVVAAVAVGACAEERTEDTLANAEQALTSVSSGSVTAKLTVNDWTAGYCDYIKITNNGAAITSWSIKMTAGVPASISSIWNTVQTTSGGAMTLNPSGNGNIASGRSLEIGFCGTGTARPTLASITVTGGSSGTGGAPGSGGRSSTGGISSSGGASSTGGGVSCSGPALTGGTQHCVSGSGPVGPYVWQLWSSNSNSCMTTYGVGAAFKATWNNSGNTLARVGLQWDSTKTYDQLGTVAADYAYKKSGTAGAWSYMGIYGWSVNPCVEYYIIDDSYAAMPVNPGNTTKKGSITIDGGVYNIYTRPTSGTGGDRCGGVGSWTQFYSIRQTSRQCGHISVTEHFKKWAALGMPLGKMIEGSLLVETGGGVGNVDYSGASMTAK